jgi:hypothetical protein
VHVTLHFAEVAFALHLFLQGLQRLIDIVVTYENLNQGRLSIVASAAPIRPKRAGQAGHENQRPEASPRATRARRYTTTGPESSVAAPVFAL